MKKVGITDLIMALSYLQDAQIDAGTVQLDLIGTVDVGAYVGGLTSCHNCFIVLRSGHCVFRVWRTEVSR